MTKGEFSLERLRKSKAYRATLRRFRNKIYFNKKFRESYLKTAKESGDKLLRSLEKMPQPKTLQEASTKLSLEGLLDSIFDNANLGKVVENNLKKDAVTDGKFKLYRKGKEVVFICNYKKGGKNKIIKAYFYLKGGLPGKVRTRGVFVKAKDFPLRGYSQIDKGGVAQARRSFEKTTLKFAGVNKYKFVIYLRGRNYENLWVERAKR